MSEHRPAEFVTAMLVLVILWLVLANCYIYMAKPEISAFLEWIR